MVSRITGQEYGQNIRTGERTENSMIKMTKKILKGVWAEVSLEMNLAIKSKKEFYQRKRAPPPSK